MTAFAEASENSVDWLRLTPDDTRFQAVNIDSLRRYGLAVDWTLRLHRNRRAVFPDERHVIDARQHANEGGEA